MPAADVGRFLVGFIIGASASGGYTGSRVAYPGGIADTLTRGAVPAPTIPNLPVPQAGFVPVTGFPAPGRRPPKTPEGLATPPVASGQSIGGPPRLPFRARRRAKDRGLRRVPVASGALPAVVERGGSGLGIGTMGGGGVPSPTRRREIPETLPRAPRRAPSRPPSVRRREYPRRPPPTRTNPRLPDDPFWPRRTWEPFPRPSPPLIPPVLPLPPPLPRTTAPVPAPVPFPLPSPLPSPIPVPPPPIITPTPRTAPPPVVPIGTPEPEPEP